MRTWPRKWANRVVFIAAGSCIVPTMIVNLAAARNGSGAIAFVVPKKIAADGEPRSRCVGTQSLCGPGGRVDHDDGSWPEAGTGPSHPGSIADRLAHVKALAAMVAG